MDAFYVVRKGDIIGVYKSLSDCQAQTGSSVCNPSVSVYKGYGLPKEAEEYLASNGLKNASYSISSTDVTKDLFGTLMPCPIQQPACSEAKASDKYTPLARSPDVITAESFQPSYSKAKASDKYNPLKRSQDVLTVESNEVVGSSSFSTSSQRKLLNLENIIDARPISSYRSSCVLEFDGASKGNPGPAGAGAVLRADDGSLVCRLREGVGIATNNVAEYRGLILGLRCALIKGFKSIRVRGDSYLVCMQVLGKWKTKHPTMADLCKEAKVLADRFTSFQIGHVARELNSEADAQANRAVNLIVGQVQEDCGDK